MGNTRFYNASGGFYSNEYHQEGEGILYEGLRGKIVVKNQPGKNGLPPYSGTSDFYAGKNVNTGRIMQVRFFKGRRQNLDFDWGHLHTNTSEHKMSFHEGVVHVHTYKNGERNNVARCLNNAEIKKYGRLLKMLDPSVKFRP